MLGGYSKLNLLAIILNSCYVDVHVAYRYVSWLNILHCKVGTTISHNVLSVHFTGRRNADSECAFHGAH